MKLTEREIGASPSRGSKLAERDDLRCACGNLMALIKKEGIEFKCRRCKRISLIPLNGIAEDVKRLWPQLLREK